MGYMEARCEFSYFNSFELLNYQNKKRTHFNKSVVSFNYVYDIVHMIFEKKHKEYYCSIQILRSGVFSSCLSKYGFMR